MLKWSFNFYEQHESNIRRTKILKFLLPFVLLIVLGIIYSAIVCFIGKDDYPFSFMKAAYSLKGKAFFWIFMIIWFAWWVGIHVTMKQVLQSPLSNIMDESKAYRVSEFMKSKDPKLKSYDDVVSELSLAYGMKKPDLYIIEETDELNAFAVETLDNYGQRNSSGIAITRSLLKLLDRSELSGVMGHELAHINADDSQTVLTFVTLASGICGLATLGWTICLLCFRIIGGAREIWTALGEVVFCMCVPVLAFGLLLGISGSSGQLFALLLRFSMSRTREFDADAMSAKVNQDPNGLISALTKIDQLAGSAKKKQLTDKYSALYLSSTKTGLLDDHPSIKARIKRLRDM